MRYKNTRTGVVINSPSTISGKYWVKLEDLVPEVKVETLTTEIKNEQPIIEEVLEAVEEETNEDYTLDGIDGITVKQIKQELDAFGIKYAPNAKKAELYQLMINGM